MVRPEGRTAKCVQSFDDSQDSAIHISYRNLLRSSSMQEPRHPLPKVIREIVFCHSPKQATKGFLHKFKLPTRRIAHDSAVSFPNHETPRLARSELTKVFASSVRKKHGNARFLHGGQTTEFWILLQPVEGFKSVPSFSYLTITCPTNRNVCLRPRVPSS